VAGAQRSTTPSPVVSELFARLRAAGAGAPATSEQVPATTGTPAARPATNGSEASPGNGVAPAPEPPVADADERLLQRRDESVEPVSETLARKLKRALQDDQNEVLDRLRSLRAEPGVNDLLGDADTHARRFRAVAVPLLADAARAGAAFDASDAADAGDGGATASTIAAGAAVRGPVGVEDLAVQLAGAIVVPLRQRVERALEADLGADVAARAEPIGAAYREWKTQRIERLAADAVAAAFVRGTFATAPAGATLRWLVDDEGGPCPDCDDNALAGPTLRGEPFPTGQPHPPAHAGCHCVLVPAVAPPAGQRGTSPTPG
jgi:hypothetical protein